MPTREQLNDLFYYQDGFLYRKRNNTKCGWINGGYYRLKIRNRLHYAHHIVWHMHYGPVPTGLVLDHIDRDKLNNRIENLRVVSRSKNSLNVAQVKRVYRGTPGIHWNSQLRKWRAVAIQNGGRVYLGIHNDRQALVWLMHLYHKGIYRPGAKLKSG